MNNFLLYLLDYLHGTVGNLGIFFLGSFCGISGILLSVIGISGLISIVEKK